MSSHTEGEGRAEAGCEAVFKDVAGCLQQLPWHKAAATVRFEELPPVASFPVIPGKRWAPGWWSATTRRHVVHGSAAMRSQLMLLDHDPRVVGLAGRLTGRDAVTYPETVSLARHLARTPRPQADRGFLGQTASILALDRLTLPPDDLLWAWIHTKPQRPV